MSPEQRRFIDDFAALMIQQGMPQGVARVYGYLMLAPEPASLDRISQDLQISKSNVSVAARLLEKHLLARRHGERGSKRALYSVSDDYSGLYAEKSANLGKLASLLMASTDHVTSAPVRQRLATMSGFQLAMKDAIEAAVAGFNEK